MKIMLDEYEQRILKELQQNGRASAQELSEAVGLSASPCWRRVKKLEDEGYIDHYAAVLNRKRMGLAALAYVHVSLTEHSEEAIASFSTFVAQNDQVIECASITGDYDFVLKVAALDPEGLEHFIMKRLLRLGVVRNATTNFVLRQTKQGPALPVDCA